MSDGASQSTHQYELDGNEPHNAGVYSAVAVLENCSPLALPPLAETIDPDALDELFGRERRTPDEVTFAYCGYEVTVTADTVRIAELDGT